jgi:hypothetical protein
MVVVGEVFGTASVLHPTDTLRKRRFKQQSRAISQIKLQAKGATHEEV